MTDSTTATVASFSDSASDIVITPAPGTPPGPSVEVAYQNAFARLDAALRGKPPPTCVI